MLFQIQSCGMEFVKDCNSVSQFYYLFKSLKLWHFEVCIVLLDLRKFALIIPVNL